MNCLLFARLKLLVDNAEDAKMIFINGNFLMRILMSLSFIPDISVGPSTYRKSGLGMELKLFFCNKAFLCRNRIAVLHAEVQVFIGSLSGISKEGKTVAQILDSGPYTF